MNSPKNPEINACIGPDKMENRININKEGANMTSNLFVFIYGVEIEPNISEI